MAQSEGQSTQSSWRAAPWLSGPAFAVYRLGRFVVVALDGAHRVTTTSSCVGGVSEAVGYLVNHQSCEASGHADRFAVIHGLGQEGYHRVVCAELGLPAEATAVMGTAANMIYASHEAAVHGDLRVDVLVTAGVEGNATCAGDPANWMETPAGWSNLAQVAGTINTMVLVNQPLKPEAQMRAIMTMTEGKSAALTELGIASRYSPDMATGTGTDQFCLAAPIVPERYAYGATNPHSKFGELIGRAVRAATKQALRWQNGLEPSMTRSLFHALRRLGFSETEFLAAMRGRLAPDAFVLLEKNKNAVLYEPQVAAAAYAYASVWDRLRFGVLPQSAGREVLRHQAAVMAASLAALPERWYEFWKPLDVQLDRPLDVVYDAMALGWTAKWVSRD